MKAFKIGDTVKVLPSSLGPDKYTNKIGKIADVLESVVLVDFGDEEIHLIPEELELVLENTGQSARYNTGKTQVRELDPAFIMGLGEVLTASRAKYTEGNWMKETKFSTPYESAIRHLMKFWSGEETDEETNKHHLLHAATNLMFLYYHTRSDVGIDDRLFKKEKK